MRAGLGLGLGLGVVGCGGGDEPGPILDPEPLWIIEDVGACGGFSSAVGRFDADDRLDVAVLSPDCIAFGGESLPTELRLYAGAEAGAPRLVASVELPASGFEVFGTRLAAVDVNGDGHDDLTVTSSLIDVAAVYLGGGNGADMFAEPFASPGAYSTSFDLDGDGAAELLAAEDGNVAAYRWNAETELFDRTEVLAGAINPRRLGDVDADGLPDLSVSIDAGAALVYGCRTGADCRDGLSTPAPLALATQPVPVGDLDGDGDGDVASWTASEVLEIHLSDDGQPSADAAWSLFPDPVDGGYIQIANVGDVDGDATSDVIVRSGPRVLLFRGGESMIAAAPSWEWRRDDWLGFVAASDLNEDGHVDLVMWHWDAGVYAMVAYAGGEVPEDATPPTTPDGFACSAHDGSLPDISTDGDMIRRTVEIERADFDEASCEVLEGCVAAPGERKLLQFSVAVQNFGGAAARIPGPDEAPELYEYDECHQHDHLVGFADYELLDEAGDVVVAGRKQGYFLVDVVPYCDQAPVRPPSGAYTDLLISPGWADVYAAGLACQWIDVTDVPDGDYRLRVRVNASGVIEEDDELPNEATVAVTIAGDVVTSAP